MAFETGWTSAPTVAPTHRWYLSVTDGNNANDGLSRATPKKTLSSLENLTVAGDEVNLDERDTWDDTVEALPSMTYFVKSGASAARPFVIQSYGAGARRAKIKPKDDGWTSSAVTLPSGGKWIRLFNLDIEGQYTGGNAVYGVSAQGVSFDQIRIEGCRFRNLFIAVRVDASTPGGDVYVRRCTFSRIYVASPSTNPIGCFFAGVTPHVSDIPVMDYCGWNPDVSGAIRTTQRRAIYVQTNCPDAELHRLVVTRSASELAQMRTGGAWSVLVGALCSGAGFTHNAGHGSVLGDRGTFFAQLGSADIDGSTPRGGGMEVAGSATYCGGLLLGGDRAGNSMGSDCLGVTIANGGVGAAPTLKGWAALDWQDSGGTGTAIRVQTAGLTVTVLECDLQASGANAKLVDLGSVATGGGGILGATSNSNRYLSGLAAPFVAPAGTFQTFPQWRQARAPAEAASALVALTFPRSAQASFAGYMASLGAAAGNQSLDGYAALAIEQRYGNWRPEYTAGAVYNYLAGCMGKRGCIQSAPSGLAAAYAAGSPTQVSFRPLTDGVDFEGYGGAYGVASYRIYRSDDGGATYALAGTVLATDATVGALSVSWSDSDLGTGGMYRVSAVDSEGEETAASAAVTAVLVSSSGGGGGGGGGSTNVSAVIDRAALMRLVEAELVGLPDVPFVPSRIAEPTDKSAWCRLKSIVLRRAPRTMQAGAAEMDSAEALVTVEVCTGQGQAAAYALESACMRVLLVLHEVRLATEAGGDDATHTLELRCDEDGAVVSDLERSIVTCEMVFRGRAQRLSGRTMLDFVT